jgi:hypothetical protein
MSKMMRDEERVPRQRAEGVTSQDDAQDEGQCTKTMDTMDERRHVASQDDAQLRALSLG